MLEVLLAAAIASSPVDEVSVFFNGQQKAVRFPPILRNGRALVHVRETFNFLDCAVKGTYGDKKVEAWRGETHIVIEVDKNYATVNGTKVSLDQPALIHPYKTGPGLLVPIRFVAQTLEAKVDYTGSSNRVDIDTSTMPFLGEKPPFKPGDKVMFLLTGKYVYIPARVVKVRDWPTSEDSYTITYKDKSGRKLTPTVGRRYIKRAVK